MTDTMEERAALAEKYARGEVRLLVTPEDLEWWYDVSERLEWRWARTFAKTAPHWYIQRERTQVLTLEEYHRALRVIWTFGTPEKYYRKVNIALLNRDGTKKWFTSNMDVSNSLINMATTENVYGEQDAPGTGEVLMSVYDEIATAYDDRYDNDFARAENADIFRLVMGERAVPSLLDVGAGTGLALDIGMIPHGKPDRYRAVDPSHGMLNRLVYKHQWVKDVWPMTAEDYLLKKDDRTFNTVISLFGSPSHVEPGALQGLYDLAETCLFLMHYKEGYQPDFYQPGDLPDFADESREAAAALPGARVWTYHAFQIVQVMK